MTEPHRSPARRRWRRQGALWTSPRISSGSPRAAAPRPVRRRWRDCGARGRHARGAGARSRVTRLRGDRGDLGPAGAARGGRLSATRSAPVAVGTSWISSATSARRGGGGAGRWTCYARQAAATPRAGTTSLTKSWRSNRPASPARWRWRWAAPTTSKPSWTCRGPRPGPGLGSGTRRRSRRR